MRKRYFLIGVVLLGSISSGLVSYGVTYAYLSVSTKNKENVVTAAETFPGQTGSVVINEVYYRVDSNHGIDSAKDQGVSPTVCPSITPTPTPVVTSTTIPSITTLNTSESIVTPTPDVTTESNTNSTSTCGENDEWIELYNNSSTKVSLEGWSLIDNTGMPTTIKANVFIRPKHYAIISKDVSTWTYWRVPKGEGITIISLGEQIGDGLDNTGDHLILKNNLGDEMDSVSWGTDTTGFTPAKVFPEIPLGSSMERKFAGHDTGTSFDWKILTNPTPGF